MFTHNYSSSTNSVLELPSSAELRTLFNGRVITAHDPGYDQARTVFYGGIDRRPAAIVRVADAGDVSRLVSLACDTGFELAVRGGGHSAAGHGVTEGGMVLDLSSMKTLQIDVKRKTAWAEAGLTAGEYTIAAGRFGLATGFGDTGSVGIGGLTLGGGVGYLVRKHGLTIDNLLAAEVVTADGHLLYTDIDTNPDLFWAVRGGGGNFGVVTRFKFSLHEVETVVGGMLILPATTEVIASFITEAQAAPDELSTIANVMTAPPMPFLPPEVHGKLVLLAMLVYAGETAAGERAIAPFRSLASPLSDMIHPMPYPEIYREEGGEYHPVAAARSMFVDSVDRAVAQTILDHLSASNASMAVTQLRVLGGAMSRVSAEATAFAHRIAPIMVNVAAIYENRADKPAHEAWVTAFATALHQRDGGTYVNFLGAEGQRRVREAYPGRTWERLAAIKRRYDPYNLFRLNQNIPPEENSRTAWEAS